MAKAKPQSIAKNAKFGKISIGAETASIRLNVEKDDLTPDLAEKWLCGRRVEVTLSLATVEDQRQRSFEGFAVEPVSSTCDISGYTSSANHWAFGVTFNLKEAELNDLVHYGARSGSVKLTEAPQEEKPADAENPDQQKLFGPQGGPEDEAEEEAAEAPPVKRPRGRPRKNAA